MLLSSFSVLGASNKGFSQTEKKIQAYMTVENLSKQSPEAADRQLNNLLRRLEYHATTEQLKGEADKLKIRVEVTLEKLLRAAAELRRERESAAWQRKEKYRAAARERQDALAESDGLLRKQICFTSNRLTRVMPRVSFMLLEKELFSSSLSQEMIGDINSLHKQGDIYTTRGGDLATNSAILMACLKALGKGTPKNLKDRRFKAFSEFLVDLVEKGYPLSKVKNAFSFLKRSYLEDLERQVAQSR